MAKRDISRRSLLKVGAGAAGLAATTNVFTARRSFAQRSKKIVFWLQPNFNPAADKLLEAQIREYAKMQGVRDNEVTILKVPGGEVGKKMAAALDVGAPPDVTRVNESNTVLWRRANALTDMTDVVEGMRKQPGGINEKLLPLVTDGGKIWAVPMGGNPQMMHARVDLLEKAGYSDFPDTQEAFTEACVKLTKTSFYAYGMALGLVPNDSGWSIMGEVWPLGGRLVDAQGRPATNSQAFIDGFERIRHLREDLKVIPRGTISWNNSGNNKAYQSGQIAFCYNPTSVYSSLLRNKSDLFDKTGLFSMPGGPDGRHRALYTDYYGVFSASPYVDLNKGLVAYLMQQDNYNGFIVGAGGRYTPVYPKLTEDPFWASNPVFADMIKVAEEGHDYHINGKLSIAFGEFNQTVVLTKALHRMLVDKESPAEAVEWLYKQQVALWNRHGEPV